MAINIIDTIEPKNNGAFPVVRDVDVAGGIQVQENTNFMTEPADYIPLNNQKVGMIVYVASNGTYYQLTATGSPGSWTSANFGGNTTLSGDVTGLGSSNTVTKIQGTSVSTNSVANDGYALVSKSGIYVPAGISPIVNIKNFGATGNGTTNDTAAIQAAFAFATANNLTRIYFPPGTYVTDPITQCSDGMIIYGAGANLSNVGTSTLQSRTGDNVIELTGHNIFSLVIRDLIIQGSGGDTWGGGFHGHGIYDDGYSAIQNLEVHNVQIKNTTGNGILLREAYSVLLNGVVTNNTLGNGIEATGFCITCINCFIENLPNTNGNFIPCGFRFYSASPVLIGCNGLYTGQDWAVFGTNGFGQAQTVSGEVTYPGDQIGTGLTMAQGACRPIIRGCNIEGFTRYGLRFCATSFGTLEGCVFEPDGPGGCVAGIKFDFNDATQGIGVIGGSCLFFTSNGYSKGIVETYGTPAISMISTVTTAYSDASSGTINIPTILGGTGGTAALSNFQLATQVNLANQTVTSSAPSGGASTTVTPAGYLDVTINGTAYKLAYYNNT
jgi:hypothetical protein